MRARRFHLAVLAIILLYAAPISSHAAVVNGGFDTGTFAGWDVVGDASVQTASVGISPTNGCCMALLTTIFNGVPFSTHSAASGASTLLQAFFGYSLSEVQNIPLVYPGHNVPYSEGESAIKQTVQGHAGELLSFDAYWVTTDVNPFLDGAVLSLAASTTAPKVLFFLSPAFGAPVTFSPSPVPLCQHAVEFGGVCPPQRNLTTGWQHYDVLLPSTDTYTIGFAVWNTVDSLDPSAILIDNVQLRIPQASSAALVVVGLLGLLFSRRWLLRAK